ncbi:MAG: DUF3237 domain-containing protein [Pseudomonadota bacterium]
MAAHGFDVSLEHALSLTAHLDAPQVVGPVPDGFRMTFNVLGGRIEGPKIKGEFVPVGADWYMIRNDGVGILDVRATIQTHDDALIYVTYMGKTDMGPTGLQDVLDGKAPPPEGHTIRTHPNFQTSHPDYEWLNRGFFVGIGKADLPNNTVSYDIYQLV